MRTVSFENGKVVLIDQTKIPHEFELIKTDDIKRIWHAINIMEVRGAPAIGVTAAYGFAITASKSKALTINELISELEEAKDYLGTSRPTATNLFWALNEMMKAAIAYDGEDPKELAKFLIEKAHKMADDDVSINEKLAIYGDSLIKDGDTIHTHCNCGPLCAVDLGTAMAPVILAHQNGKKIHVFTDETRPRFQGAKLNAWELSNAGVPYTLIPDNSAAYVMSQKKVDMVMIGVDRVASNGDTAAKIGVYGVALLAKAHNIPFYAVSPKSTIDMSLLCGADIPIEERDPDEVRKVNGTYVTMPDANVLNYAFDVTPNELITAIITEDGIVYPPFKENLKKIMGE